ncbi:MAG TPA: PHP domain-containing protein [Nitrospira sp.]|nr:PHP domain-containing protein [Nitrospira sp.]
MMTKRDIARTLSDIAFLLRLNEDNPYKALAYARAAQALLASPQEPRQLLEGRTLTDIPGIGGGIAAVIRELIVTGRSTLYERVKGSYPASAVELGHVPGLRTKQIRRVYEEAGIASIADLQAACRNNRLLSLKGIGPKVQARIQTALGEFRRGQGYRLYADVVEEASMVETNLRALRGVQQAAIAGDLRRKMEVVNAFRFVVTWPKDQRPARFLMALGTIPNLTDAAFTDARRVTAVSPTGVPITIVLTQPGDHDLHLLRETGSDQHLEDLLTRFAAAGLHGWGEIRRRARGWDEEAIYRLAGVPYVPPVLREGRGELDLAGATLRRLVDRRHIQGCFHLHTDYSDGAGTVEEMVRAARERGYRYIGVSDHSRSAFYANGLEEPRIRQQWLEIEAVQKKYPDIHVFKGIEADILPDGSMDYPDELLCQFDFVIASVHSRFNLSEADQTRRVCRALANPYVTMLGHPSGRLLLSRSGYRLNMTQVIDTAKRYGKVLEINGSRHRLDLDWRDVRSGKTAGLKFSLNPDAHAVDELDNVALAVNVAQKGGLVAEDVMNAQPLPALKAFFNARQEQAH